MLVKSTNEGCILVNDINCFTKTNGGKTFGNKSNFVKNTARFTDLGVPVGFLSTKRLNQSKTYKDETNIDPISEKSFNYFVNKMLP
jgi:hypothetical protein